MKINYQLIFENDDFLVVNKMPGVLIIPDRFDPEIMTLQEMIEEKTGKPVFVVHRIDKNTSGLTVFAKNKKSHASLNKLFMEKDIQKTYLALVKGYFAHEHFEASYPLRELKSGKTIVDLKDGKEAVTSFSLLEKFRDYSLVQAEPKTGKMHQIRVHLSFMGTPILCDDLYGFKKPLLLSSLKKKNFKLQDEEEEKPLIARTALHAYKIAFHWKGKKDFSFEAPLPKDFKAVLTQLSKYNKEIF
ncbi:MAG TPA: RNA pseudouridine synthase [Spirochaetia bacterium]|nr:MAG: hypothetical protein A2Y41_07040 [Spirochaetes bacterium GWB1_36_13]HCL55810.1 RNA pseudouridine synthase [Spirochaetia bacterium]